MPVKRWHQDNAGAGFRLKVWEPKKEFIDGNGTIVAVMCMVHSCAVVCTVDEILGGIRNEGAIPIPLTIVYSMHEQS